MDSPSFDAAPIPPPCEATDPSAVSASPQLPEREVEVQAAAVLRSEEYRQLFRLPAEEVLVEDFNCAYQENIPVQGHMYLFAHHICFYSNIFGFETKKIIHFPEITSVKRAKTAGIFPNAIEIYAGGKKYFFASFLSRDEAFNLICNGWLNHGGSSSEITEKQALTPQSSFRENGFESDGVRNLTDDSDVETSERNVDAPVCMDSLTVPDSEDGDLSTTGQKTEDNAGSHDGGLQLTCPSLSTQKAWSWKVEDVDAGKIPEDLTKVAESKFPITVEEFFDLFYSDGAFNFVESFHKRCGDKDFKCSSWKKHDHFGHTRNVSFQHPIKLYLGARCCSCRVLQKFRVFRSCNLVIQTSQEMDDIPFGDYFRVEGLWDVRRDGDGSCCLSVYVRVAFVKKTLFKGKIVQSTVEECREVYASWIEMAHDLLKEKNIEKREDVTPECSTALNRNGWTQDAGNIEPSETFPPPINNSGAPKNSSSTTLDRHGRPILQSLVNSETIILIQERAVKLWSKLRSQIHLPLLVAVLFTIILLIQLCIVMLLSSPQSVQVVSQANYANKVEDRTTEAMAWLEKRLYYLKEEVSLVEARFERMQWEYSRIKQQLGELEEFHHKKLSGVRRKELFEVLGSRMLLNSLKKRVQVAQRSDNFVYCLLVGVLVSLLVATYQHWSKRSNEPNGMNLSNFETLNTPKGYITVELFKDGAPEIVDKFLDLCQKGHFKGMLFHRVIKHYVVRGGGGDSEGLGAAEDWISKEKLRTKRITSPKDEAFMLDDKKFGLFITTAPIPDLNDRFIAFGRVVKGPDVVQEIEEVYTNERYHPKSSIGEGIREHACNPS